MGSFLSSSNNNQVEWTPNSRNVLITGALKGIGAELARKFAKEGANLALLARSKDALENVAKECRELADNAVRVSVHPCDLTKNEEISEAVSSAVSVHEMFDVVVLNAGRSQGCYFEEINDVDQIDYMLKLNVSGVVVTLKNALPFVHKTKHSRIVVLSSVAGLLPVPYRTIYCASKSALNAFCGSLRMELNDTHGSDNAPRIVVVNFPEVRDTALNNNRMDFGAKRPQAEFDPATAQELSPSCDACMAAIASGVRSWGHPLKVLLLLYLLQFVPSLVETLLMNHVKKAHSRPDEETIITTTKNNLVRSGV